MYLDIVLRFQSGVKLFQLVSVVYRNLRVTRSRLGDGFAIYRDRVQGTCQKRAELMGRGLKDKMAAVTL